MKLWLHKMLTIIRLYLQSVLGEPCFADKFDSIIIVYVTVPGFFVTKCHCIVALQALKRGTFGPILIMESNATIHLNIVPTILLVIEKSCRQHLTDKIQL